MPNKLLRNNDVSYRVNQSGNVVTIWTVVATSWLLAPDRKFPVIVDPTINIFCSGTNYTGFHDGFDGSTYRGDYLVGLWDAWFNAYAEANISSISDAATISSVTFYQYEWNAWNNTIWGLTMLLTDMANRGSTQSGIALRNDIMDGSTFISETSIPFAVGWRSYALNATGVADFQGRLTDDWFAVGVKPWAAFNVNYAGFIGWSNASRPYFFVNYTACTNPSNPSASGTATICSGASTNISATSTNATLIYWYTGGCGSTFQGTSNPGANFSVSPATTTTYYARGYNSAGGGCWSAGCGSVTITVDPVPVAASSISASTTSMCTGSSVTITRNGASVGQDRWWMRRDGVQWAEFIDGYAGSSSWNRTLNVPGSNASYTYRVYHHPYSGACDWHGWNHGTWSPVITVYSASVGGTASSSAGSICNGSTVTLTLAGYRGSIQWQSSPAGCGSWTNIGGATSTPYVTAALTSTTCFRARVTNGVCGAAYSTTS